MFCTGKFKGVEAPKILDGEYFTIAPTYSRKYGVSLYFGGLSAHASPGLEFRRKLQK